MNFRLYHVWEVGSKISKMIMMIHKRAERDTRDARSHHEKNDM